MLDFQTYIFGTIKLLKSCLILQNLNFLAMVMGSNDHIYCPFSIKIIICFMLRVFLNKKISFLFFQFVFTVTVLLM